MHIQSLERVLYAPDQSRIFALDSEKMSLQLIEVNPQIAVRPFQ